MSLHIESLAIPDVRLVTPKRFEDARGFFSEAYNERAFHEAGISANFIQDNHSYSAQAHTVRGLHFQSPPFQQAKLVRVVRGAIRDVAVDVRKGSPTYGSWVSAHLTANSGMQMFVPAGFLHGFVTLEDDTEVVYKVDAYYSRECDGAVLFNDPDLGIDWGVDTTKCILSEKDRRAQSFSEFQTPF